MKLKARLILFSLLIVYILLLLTLVDNVRQHVKSQKRILNNSESNRDFESQNLSLVNELKKNITYEYWRYRNTKILKSKSVEIDQKRLILYNLWNFNLINDTKSENWVYYDRLLLQLTWMMSLEYSTKIKLNQKTIRVVDSMNRLGFSEVDFMKNCPVLSKSCHYTNKTDRLQNISAILFQRDQELNKRNIVESKTARIYYTLESNYHSELTLKRSNDLLVSYWRGSHLVAPYAKWTYYDERIHYKNQGINYAEGKRKLAAMFTSNCNPVNRRMKLVAQLQKFIPIDVFGKCGPFNCSRKNESTCFKKLKREYKFYLAFENSNCRDYITEKVYMNALSNNLVPVVLGAHPSDYEEALPYHSYIHVENFRNVESLANYLKDLDADDTKYNSYFKWKGTGEFIKYNFFCHLCAMLHYGYVVKFPERKKYFHWVNRTNMCLKRKVNYWSSNKI